MEYTLIRSKRKSIAIRIKKDATLEVRAPLRMSMTDIDKFIQSKQTWINKHLKPLAEKCEKREKFELDYGQALLYLGKPYTIVARPGNIIGFDDCFYMPENLDHINIKHSAIQIYKMLAKRVLMKKVSHYSKLMKLTPTNVKINSARTRWGSCSGKNSINFSWLLIMAEEKLVDYVVVHELAHIKEHNHSQKFWAVVESVIPDYKERRLGLKVLQEKLSAEDWD